MLSAANSHVKMAKVSRTVPDTSVQRSRSSHADTKSKPACLYWHGAREKVRYFHHKHPNFFYSCARIGLTEQVYGEKVGETGHFQILFSKNSFFPKQDILKQAFYLVIISTVKRQETWTGSFCDNLKSVSTKKLSRLYSKAKMTDPP